MEPSKPAIPNQNFRRRKLSSSSLNEEHIRSASVGYKRQSRVPNTSRDLSTGSVASLDVRCACQYFQCDSLLPERTKNASSSTRPNYRPNIVVTQHRDHEYEPVNPPPENITIVNEQIITQTPTPIIKTNIERKSPKKSKKNQNFIRIPLHDDVVISSDGDDTDKNGQDDSLSAQEIQDRLEAQYFSAPVAAAKTTSSFRQTEQPTTSQKKDNKSAMLTQIEGQGKKIKDAFNTQTGKFKTKIKGMKRPNISMPSRPKFDKAKIERIKKSMPKMPDKSKFKMPKIPETKLNLPSFSLPKRSTATSKIKQRQYSTESNAGDSKMKIFDFSTYPRIFKGRKKDTTFEETSTIPRASKDSKKAKEAPKTDSPVYIRIPLHSEESMDQDDSLNSNKNTSASHTRYNDAIDVDDAFVKENQEIHRASPFSSKYIERWKHGTFHGQINKKDVVPETEFRTTDLDNSEDITTSNGSSVDPRNITSGSLGDIHGRGVIEEINEDEFFVRQKGISQDNIEVGEYLTSEIREAFKNPINPLRQMQDDSYDREYEIDVSDQSLEETPKRKPIRKPKRKRTPHVSQEKIAYDQESITTEPEEYPKAYPPGRPKRRSKKGEKVKKDENVIPYRETISVNEQENYPSSEVLPKTNQFDLEHKHHDIQMYENEHMKGIEQPEIFISNAYYQRDIDDFIDDFHDMPLAPPRKHRSLKSLTPSEHDSIIGEYNRDKDFTSQEIEAYRMEHEYIIPTPEIEPPTRPRRSRTRSQSHATPTVDEVEVINDESRMLESEAPCVEPSCIRDLRDAMGYAIIDKSRQHEPPLPPPRLLEQPKTPPRRRRGKLKDNETKFFTVPRPLNDAPPVRPLRNYSTLSSSNLSKKKVSLQNLTDEEKENVDVSQYSEIPDEDELNRNLKSGDVVQKMKDRPLPAPPRPPRKTRGGRILRDITNEDDIDEIVMNIEKDIVEEAEISTQTEPLPDDFECGEVIQEKHDKILTPTQSFEHQETITHGSLIVQPIDNAQILPEDQLSRERIIPITRDDNNYYENETTEIPEDFHKLKDPEPREDTFSKTPIHTEVETLKAQKLQVGDLDVDRLTVNELLASKIRVSEIDSNNIQVSEINSQGGNLVVSGIELPASFLQQLVDRIQSASHSPVPTATTEQDDKIVEEEQKKTPIEPNFEEDVVEAVVLDRSDGDLPEVPARLELYYARDEEVEVPERPPRMKHEQPTEYLEEIPNIDLCSDIPIAETVVMQETESEGDIPPPRPPQPFDIGQEHLIYLPSQPPPSFYSLQSPLFTEFIDDDIPLAAPRRRRHHKQHIKESSSEETVRIQRRSRRSRTPEASIPELALQLTQACTSEAERQFKRLITYITNYVLDHADGQRDLHVTVVILLVLIAILILLGFGSGTTVHYHHWEYFNPPKNL